MKDRAEEIAEQIVWGHCGGNGDCEGCDLSIQRCCADLANSGRTNDVAALIREALAEQEAREKRLQEALKKCRQGFVNLHDINVLPSRYLVDLVLLVELADKALAESGEEGG